MEGQDGTVWGIMYGMAYRHYVDSHWMSYE
jgi:hypothetical protein